MPTLVGEMLELRRGLKSGVLEVAAAGAPTLIYHVGGKMVFAEQGKVADSFGRVLVESGWLTREQFDQAMARMQGKPFLSEQWRFSETVVELGLLTREQVGDALALHVQELILDCMAIDHPHWAFLERADPVERAARFLMRLEPLVLAATTRLDAGRLDAILGRGGRRAFRLVGEAESIAARFELNAAEQRLLEHLDGRRSSAELAAIDPNAPALVAALFLVGCAEAGGGVSSMPAGAPRSTIPAAPPRPSTPAASVPAVAATSTIPAPMNGHLSSGPPPDPGSDPRSLAASAFRLGQRRLFGGDLRGALLQLRRAFELVPSSIEYDLCLQWAEWRAAADAREAAQPVPTRLWELAVKAVKEEPRMAFGYYVLGHVAKERAEPKRALAMFRRATELDANFIDAARQALLLSRG